MIAAAPSLSSSSSSSASSSSHLFRDRVFRRSSSLPPLRTATPTQIPRVSASCAAAPERERERTSAHNSYSYSRSYSSGRGMLAAETLYDVLGLASEASAQEIKAAYRRLARSCHPDVVGTERKGASADEFMRVHAAYATLSDPGRRAEYDRRVIATSLMRRRNPFTWASPASSSSSSSSYAASYYSPPSPASPNYSSPSASFGRRTWETDQCW